MKKLPQNYEAKQQSFSDKIIRMKIVKNIVKALLLLMALLIIGGAIYLYQSGPTLPGKTAAIIESVLKKPVPQMVTGQTGFASNKGVKIWYESKMPLDTPKATVLLIMGISNDALGWPPAFLRALVDAGYQVIRYDHRGTGLSDWMDHWEAESPYSLADMAKDGIAVMDALGIQKAHILGASMGGMIAQEMAIKHTQRVQSLTSIMSSSDVFATDLPPISSNTAIELIKVAAKYGILGGEKNLIKLHLASRLILMGENKHALNIEEIATLVLYNIRARKGYNSQVSPQHQAAVTASDSRTAALQQLNLPTLVVHGKADPFIPFAHGQKMARLMPNSDSLWVDDMGHDIPDNLIPSIIDKITNHFWSTEKTL